MLIYKIVKMFKIEVDKGIEKDKKELREAILELRKKQLQQLARSKFRFIFRGD